MAPIPNNLETLINSGKIVIFKKEGCRFCVQVKAIFDELETPYVLYDVETMADGNKVRADLLTRTRQKTVPNVFINGIHMGGCSDIELMRNEGTLLPVYNRSIPHYDFDLLVVGGGSGGLATARDAASYTKRIAVIDYVQESPQGTTWGLGGTCVNVGCIPKKLMHQAALHGANIKDAPFFGWGPKDQEKEDVTVAIPVRHSWSQMVQEIQAHIKSLNWGYRVALTEKNIVYLNGLAKFADPHTVVVTEKKGMKHTITAANIVIAIGCRPNYPFGVQGAIDYGITSDDLFSLNRPPGKTLIVGASYIALECAGFLAGLGVDTTVMVRSILLRGFDRQMSEMIGEQLKKHGVKFIENCVVSEIHQKFDSGPGNFRVTGKFNSREEHQEDFNTIMFAMGRSPNTMDIGLKEIGVELHVESNKIITNDYEQSSVPHIYAIGDVAHGRVELTPVAIQAGKLLSQRLFNSKTAKMDYVNVPTTVFTPVEYGCCGYSEEAAIKEFGSENIEVYHNVFQPLEFVLSERKEEAAYGKLVCLKSENERVVGFHVIGPNAGEVTQGFALGMRLGATMADFSNLVGIHPTCAEAFTTMRVTKASGTAMDKSSC